MSEEKITLKAFVEQLIAKGGTGGRSGARAADAAIARMIRRPAGRDGARLRGRFTVTCRAPDGSVKWTAESPNLIVNEGLDHLLDATLSGATQITAWHIGLKGTGTGAAGDTMASHAGWTEDQNYDEATRVQWVDGGVTSQSVDNSGSVAQFSMNATTTIGGMFLVSDNTKGGATGVLFAVTDFTGGSKAADAGDTLEVTYTCTSADDGVGS